MTHLHLSCRLSAVFYGTYIVFHGRALNGELHKLLKICFSILKHLLDILTVFKLIIFMIFLRRGVAVITTGQLHLANSELRFSAGSKPARGFYLGPCRTY